MKKLKYLIMLLVFCIAALAGCARVEQRAEPAVTLPARTGPAQDVPPAPDKENVHIETSVKPKTEPAVSATDKSSLMYYAKLDLLRILICSDEQILIADEKTSSDRMLQQVSEHFTDIGFRVVEGSPCPEFSSSAPALNAIANDRDVDMFVLLRAESTKVDKFGDYYSYEADGRGKVSQITDKELVTTRSLRIRGKRALNESQAAESALTECGKELAKKLSDEILRKSARGALLRRISIEGLDRAEYVDYVRMGLAKKPGIQSVSLVTWDRTTGRAIFWVRLDASVKENLAAYLENLKDIKLKVDQLDKTGVETHKKTLLEF